MNKDELDNWVKIALKTKSSPFIVGKPSCRVFNSELILKPGSINRIVFPLFLLILGIIGISGVIISFITSGFGFRIGLVLGAFLGVIMIYAGLAYLFSARELRCNISSPFLFFQYGVCFKRKQWKLPRESVFLKKEISGYKGAFSQYQHGCIMLSLCLKDPSENAPKIVLMESDDNQVVSSVLKKLSEYINIISDETIVEEFNGDGHSIKFFKTGVSHYAFGFPTRRMVYRVEKSQIIFRRSFYEIALWSGILVFGIIMFLIVISLTRRDWPIAFYLIGIFPFVALGVVGLFIGFGTVKVIADKKTSTVEIKEGFFGKTFGKRAVLLQQIYGIQICPKYIPGGENKAYTVFELNFVVEDKPLAERIHIMSDTNESQIISYAKKLSSFIEKPLYDNRILSREI